MRKHRRFLKQKMFRRIRYTIIKLAFDELFVTLAKQWDEIDQAILDDLIDTFGIDIHFDHS